MPENNQQNITSDSSTTKKCPYCAEQINSDAIKCKHCKSDLTNKEYTNAQRSKQNEISKPEAKKKKSTTSCLITFFVVMAVIVAIVVAVGSCSDEADKTNGSEYINEPEEAKESPPPVTMQFDVPSLMGKDFTEIKSILGEPTELYEPTKQQLNLGVSYDAIWDKDDAELQVSFFNSQNKINYIYIGGNSNGYSENQLKTLGNLHDSGLKTVPVKTSSGEVIGLAVCNTGYTGEDGILGSEYCEQN